MLSYQYLWEHEYAMRRARSYETARAVLHHIRWRARRRAKVEPGRRNSRWLSRAAALVRHQLTRLHRRDRSGPRAITIILAPHQTHSFPGGTGLVVRAGTIWVTDRGRDVMIRPGGTYCSNDAHAPIVAVNPARRPATVTVSPPDVHGCEM